MRPLETLAQAVGLRAPEVQRVGVGLALLGFPLLALADATEVDDVTHRGAQRIARFVDGCLRAEDRVGYDAVVAGGFRVMKPNVASLLAVLLGGCAPSTGTNPPRAEPSPALAEPQPTEPSPAEAVVDDVDARSAVEPVTAVSEIPVDAELWRPPLPMLSLETLSDAEKEQVRVCVETHHLDAPDPLPAELMAAATCLRDTRSYGAEIRLYKVLLAEHHSAEDLADAQRRLALRLEQIDSLHDALDAYASYLRYYRKNEDSLAVGRRAVCLARAVSNPQREEDLLRTLQTDYGRKGFVRPQPEALPELCGEAPP